MTGATEQVLKHALKVDYAKYKTPKGALLVAGSHDLLKGRTVTSMTNSIQHLKNAMDEQDAYHPNTPNQFVVANVPNCPTPLLP